MRQGLTEPLRVPIVRARIKLNPVESQLLDGGVGWISIKSFHANVEAGLGEQLSISDERLVGVSAASFSIFEVIPVDI